MSYAVALPSEEYFSDGQMAISSERQPPFHVEVPPKDGVCVTSWRSSPWKSYRVRRALRDSRSRVFTIESSSNKKYGNVLAEVERLSAYPAGWNGPRSVAASPESFSLAKKFIELLQASSKAFKIGASIHAAGNAMLEIQGTNLVAQIEFLPNGEIAANIDDPKGAQDFDLEHFDGTGIPGELASFFV